MIAEEARLKIMQALDNNHIKRIPDILTNSEAILWDKNEPGSLIYVFSPKTNGAKKAKAIVKVNFTDKGKSYNIVGSSGLVNSKNLKDI